MEELFNLNSGTSKKKNTLPFDQAVVFIMLTFFSDPGTVSTGPLSLFFRPSPFKQGQLSTYINLVTSENRTRLSPCKPRILSSVLEPGPGLWESTRGSGPRAPGCPGPVHTGARTHIHAGPGAWVPSTRGHRHRPPGGPGPVQPEARSPDPAHPGPVPRPLRSPGPHPPGVPGPVQPGTRALSTRGGFVHPGTRAPSTEGSAPIQPGPV